MITTLWFVYAWCWLCYVVQLHAWLQGNTQVTVAAETQRAVQERMRDMPRAIEQRTAEIIQQMWEMNHLFPSSTAHVTPNGCTGPHAQVGACRFCGDSLMDNGGAFNVPVVERKGDGRVESCRYETWCVPCHTALMALHLPLPERTV